jgi:hypothetical protein
LIRATDENVRVRFSNEQVIGDEYVATPPLDGEGR